jgi:hypothetical protein
MKLRNVVTTRITIQPNVMEKERSKSAPTPVEIRLQAFEIHIERGGIQRFPLDTWQPTDVTLNKSSQTRQEKQPTNEMGHRGDLEVRERSVAVKPPSLLGWYRILRAQYHWAVFQAIRYALWLAR